MLFYDLFKCCMDMSYIYQTIYRIANPNRTLHSCRILGRQKLEMVEDWNIDDAVWHMQWLNQKQNGLWSTIWIDILISKLLMMFLVTKPVGFNEVVMLSAIQIQSYFYRIGKTRPISLWPPLFDSRLSERRKFI